MFVAHHASRLVGTLALLLAVPTCAVSGQGPALEPGAVETDDDTDTEVSEVVARGDVLGRVERLGTSDNGVVRLTGWACQFRIERPVRVALYAGDGGGAAVAEGRADQNNGADAATIRNKCGTNATPHRFAIALPIETLQRNQGRRIFVRVVKDNGGRDRLRNASGWVFPPPVPGGMGRTAAHPHVLTTDTEIRSAIPALQPGAARRGYFNGLEAQVAAMVNQSREDWYADIRRSCGLGPISYALSYGGNPTTRAAYGLRAQAQGAALASAAYYSRLVKLGATPGQADLADRAAVFVHDVLLRWSTQGLRDGDNRFRSRVTDYCDDKVKSTDEISSLVGLHLGYGALGLAHAYDLMLGQDAFSAAERQTVDRFFVNVYDVIARSNFFRAHHVRMECNRFSNHVSYQTAALLATAAVADDAARVDFAMWGNPRVVAIPYSRILHENLYGRNEPLLGCYEPLDRREAKVDRTYQTREATRGEIVDRYHWHSPGQDLEAVNLEYTMFSLRALLLGAEVARNQGFNVYRTSGPFDESLPTTLDYYARYVTRFGYNTPIPAESAVTDPLPNQRLYATARIKSYYAGSFLLGGRRIRDDEGRARVAAAGDANPVRDAVDILFAPSLR